MNNKLTVFIDGSCLSGGGAGALGDQGPSGWTALIMGAGKLVKELGGTFRRSTSSAMEEKAFLEVLNAWEPNSGIHLEVVTDYLACLQGMEAIAKGKKSFGFADDKFTGDIASMLKAKGLKVDPKAFSHTGNVKTTCGKLTVIKIKAHAGDDVDLSTLDFYTLGNRAADKRAKEWARKSLI